MKFFGITFDYANLKRFFKFGMVGGTGVFVNSGFLFLLTERFHLDYKAAGIAAIELAIINNFIWNSLWTWNDRKANKKRHISKRFLKFNVSSGLTALIINWGLLVLLTEFFGMYYMLSNLIGIICGTALNFAVSHFWVFKHKLDESIAN